jgi:hypothetical protein
MFRTDLVDWPSKCPACGCGDLEQIGNRRNGSRFLCLEGHQFEVPKRPRFPARRRHRQSAGG